MLDYLANRRMSTSAVANGIDMFNLGRSSPAASFFGEQNFLILPVSLAKPTSQTEEYSSSCVAKLEKDIKDGNDPRLASQNLRRHLN